MKSPCERIPFIKLQTQSKLYSISGDECNWMCSFYHPYYGSISFVNLYRVKFTKRGLYWGGRFLGTTGWHPSNELQRVISQINLVILICMLLLIGVVGASQVANKKRWGFGEWITSSIIHGNIWSLIHKKCHPKTYHSNIKHQIAPYIIFYIVNMHTKIYDELDGKNQYCQ